MVAPVSTTFTITSGSLSTLDRYSAYGVSEPSVHMDTPSVIPGSNVYEFAWDFVDTAVHVTGMWHELSLTGSLGLSMTAKGSNDGTNWTDITVGTVDSSYSTGGEAVFRWTATLSTDKFFRYLKMIFTVNSISYSSSLNLKFQAVNFGFDSARPWSADGSGGVGPGGGTGPGDGEGGGANDPGGENDPSTHEGFAMSDLAVYAGDMVLDWIKGNAFAAPPDNVWIALFDGDPDATTSPGSEVTGTIGLTRQMPTFGAIVNRYMLNTNKIEFGAPTSDVTVAAFALYDAETGGNRITLKVLAAPSTFVAETPIIIQPGKLPVYY